MSFLFKFLFSKLKCASNPNSLESLLNNPNTTDQEKEIIKSEINKEHQPGIIFSRLPMIYKSQISNNWDGLKLGLLFNPNGFFNLDYSYFFQRIKKKLQHKYELGANCFLPTSQDGSTGVMLVGRKEGYDTLSLQTHINITPKDKIAIISQYPNSSMEQNAYTAEISHDFDRINIAAKVGNAVPSSISAVSCLYRNLFFGVEAFKYPGEYKLGYNYSLFLKQGPRNRLGFIFGYMVTLPGMFADLCYKINDQFNFGVNWMKAVNPMVGGAVTDASINGSFNNGTVDIGTELNKNGTFRFVTSYNILSNLALSMNFSLAPRNNMGSRKPKIHNFGIGVTFNTSPVEEVLQKMMTSRAEDLDEYDYEKMAKGGDKI